MRLYSVTQGNSSIKLYKTLDDNLFREELKDRYDAKLDEISREGYAHHNNQYIIDIDYNGPFTTYYHFFDKIRNDILSDIREEKLNKLNI
jgi:hypothetical protein